MIEPASRRNQRALRARGHLLVGYLLAGYPSRDGFLEALRHSVQAGLDIVEVGFPSHAPVNDGQVLQDAHRQADFSILDDPAYWKQVRDAVQAPLWIMGYNGELLDAPRALRLAQAGCADAFVLPGMQPEERLALSEALRPHGCDVLGFLNPHTPQEEAIRCFETMPLIYMQLHVGQTGAKVECDCFEPLLRLGERYPQAHLFAGFGIKTPERVAYLLDQGFTGTIVGTGMIKKQNESMDALTAYVRSLKTSAKKERFA